MLQPFLGSQSEKVGEILQGGTSRFAQAQLAVRISFISAKSSWLWWL